MSLYANSTTSTNVSNPPLTQSDAIESLLSLALTSANEPISSETATQSHALSSTAPHSLPSNNLLSTSIGSGVKTHRRLASTGKTKRRLSDAREAAVRPSPVVLQTSAAALSLASLSLSSSPPSQHAQISTSLMGASKAIVSGPTTTAPLNDESNFHQLTIPNGFGGEEKPGAIPIANGRHGKKRGMDHKCESCSKIYRHPSCLIKHRWEHTPHWREASKFVLSKHQQVQLLEAAAILSHLSPSASGGKSLPEDRSLWPSFLSGGSLPPPEPPVPAGTAALTAFADEKHEQGAGGQLEYPTYPVSSSVPALSAAAGGFKRSPSAGPRLHDYSVPVSAGSVSAVRPGVLGVPTVAAATSPGGTAPVAVPNTAARDAFAGYRSPGSFASSSGIPGLGSYAGAQGWSLPRSSIRSGSRSRSTSRSEDDDASLDGEVVAVRRYSYGRWKGEEEEFGYGVREEDEEDEDAGRDGVRKIKVRNGRKEEWDDMELEMDMD